ncbi:MAG: serine/threonine-protein phosphatase [Rhizobacter sp.]|nr:serine/threonine-protein phosphatase [Rhizobacter sp.]
MTAPTPLDVAVALRSELGQRKSNEDNVRVCRDGERWVAILADGAGGHRGGAEAARRAVDVLEAALCAGGAAFDADALTAGVLAAHADVFAAAQRNEHGTSRMHTTVAVLWVDAQRASALWSHVGDSRLYRVRDGVAVLLTSDDSVVQRMVDAGLMTEEQAVAHPQKNQLLAALGIEDDVQPHTASAPIRDGDAFLLCSDGWWDALDLQAISEDLVRGESPDDWLDAMQQRIESRAAPRQDNFSAVAVWLHESGDSTRPMAIG